MRKNRFLSLILVLLAALLSACGSLPGSKLAESVPSAPPPVEIRQPTAISQPTVRATETEQVAANQAVLLQQAQQELSVFQEVAMSSNQVAREVVLKAKVTDLSFCMKIPPVLTRVKHYATHGGLAINMYRGRCIEYVAVSLDQQKFKPGTEVVMGKKTPPPPAKKK